MKTEQHTAEYWEHWIVSAIARETEQPMAGIDALAPITSFALDSIITVTLAADLEAASGREVDPTVFWEFPDIKTLAAWMASQ
jgi:acyl carrier protein